MHELTKTAQEVFVYVKTIEVEVNHLLYKKHLTSSDVLKLAAMIVLLVLLILKLLKMFEIVKDYYLPGEQKLLAERGIYLN